MSIIYMLSGPAKNSDFPTKIKDKLKKDLKNKKNIVFIPTTPYNFIKNDLYVYGDDKDKLGILKYINEINLFKNISIIDYRLTNRQSIDKIINADVLYLLGGNPFTQLEYIKSEKYNKLIKNFSGVIIGTSAGSMNLAKKAYCSKDEDFSESVFYEGIGIVDITIDPHFEINNKIQISEITKNSHYKKIIGLPDTSGIRISDNNVEYINKCYLFNEGQLEEIN